MKANTSRSDRLNFDADVESYDTARPGVPLALVEQIRERARLSAGADVLEIGAATGQLTLPLRTAGFRVVAIEPGDRLRQRLAAKVADDPDVTLHGGFFEDYDGLEAPFAAVWSSNAFHWVDPAVSYAKAADLLAPGGSLVLLWNFAFLPADLQRELNEKVFAPHAVDAVREPDDHEETLVALTAEGRDELAASGRYQRLDWWFHQERLGYTVDRYVAMLLSFGHLAAAAEAERADIAERVRAVLAERKADRLELTNYVYCCIAPVIG
jgi:SAM-dependent methyltransferase